MSEFDAVEARLGAIVDRYRDRLESKALYGVETLGRPGGRAHDYFIGLRTGKRYVSLYVLPVYGRPSLLDEISPALRRRMQGKACFNFAAVDEPVMTELEALVDRSYEVYTSDEYRRLVAVTSRRP
ncbi:MAG TPA: hypothetical protein VGC90_06585 [Candidatus Limnocylindrales bacterium]